MEGDTPFLDKFTHMHNMISTKSQSSVSHVEVPYSLLSTTIIKRKAESQHIGRTPNTSNKLKAPMTINKMDREPYHKDLQATLQKQPSRSNPPEETLQKQTIKASETFVHTATSNQCSHHKE